MMDYTENTKKYREILDLEYPFPSRHVRMATADRAAQFGAFSALTGYDDAIDETARLTDSMIDLSEDFKEMFDVKQRILERFIHEQPDVTVTYFISDEKKSGGAYKTVTGKILRIDQIERLMLLTNGSKIPLDKICGLESPCFQSFFGVGF